MNFTGLLFVRRVYPDLDTLQIDPDEYMRKYNDGPTKESYASREPEYRPLRMARTCLRRKTWTIS